MAEINHEIKIRSSLDKTLKALSNVTDLKAWHTARTEDKGNNTFLFRGTDKPEFLWQIDLKQKDNEIDWNCLEGPGSSAGTKAIYNLSKVDDQTILVELKHTSWPDQEGNYRKCNTLWGILLDHLKKYLETGKSDPAIL